MHAAAVVRASLKIQIRGSPNLSRVIGMIEMTVGKLLRDDTVEQSRCAAARL